MKAMPLSWKGPIIWALFCASLLLILHGIDKTVPPQHLPWKPLETSSPLGAATKIQLMRLSLSSSETCMMLARDTEEFQSIPALPKEEPSTMVGGNICGWKIARLVYGQDKIVLSPGEANMQCPLSIATYLWTREIDKIAKERYGEGLAKIHHMGTYSCRRQNGNNSGKWSEHAYANAWDIAGFELENGHLVTVLKHWDTVDKDAAFLRDIRSAACKIFNVTLSPDFNAAHRDHFHVDMGPAKSCR
jgi:hypothetical protein